MDDLQREISIILLLWMRCLIFVLSAEVAIRYGMWAVASFRDHWESNLRPHLIGTSGYTMGLTMFALFGLTAARFVPPSPWRLTFYLMMDLVLIASLVCSLFTCWFLSGMSGKRASVQFALRIPVSLVVYTIFYVL